MDPVVFLLENFEGFMALLLRLTGLFILGPVFSNEVIPNRIKGMFVLLVAALSFPTLAASGVLPATSSFAGLTVLGAGEIFIGFTIGFMMLIVLTIFRISGQFYSIQMGFGIINVFDPMAESSVPIISQLKALLMSVVFLIIGGHRFLLEAVFKSYEFVPSIYSLDPRPIARVVATQFDKMFEVGFVIAIPLIGIVFLMTMSLGLLSKLAPQMNVMILGFGLKVMVGLLTFISLLPAFMFAAQQLFDEIFHDVYVLMEAMG